uniref:Uncharacterized protein n=1 Tax=Anguilla anguilla TaxID=7936 RepID=A0A0E9QQB7_ANGAN
MWKSRLYTSCSCLFACLCTAQYPHCFSTFILCGGLAQDWCVV